MRKKNRNSNRRIYIFYFISLLIAAFASVILMHVSTSIKPGNFESVDQWGVSSGHPWATRAGMDILNHGGNAVDAAVAVAYALGVVEPYACGIGGGGEMLIYWNKDQKIRVFDYRETATLSDKYQGNLSVTGVPGFVKGMDTVLKKYGTMDRATLMKPAIVYASTGVPVSKTLARLLVSYHNNKLRPGKNPEFFQDGRPLRSGENLLQISLAQQLKLIAKNGASAFYQMFISHTTEKLTNHSNLPFTLSDIYHYRVLETKAVRSKFHDYTVYSVPPPGGGATLIEMLRLAEISNATTPGRPANMRVPLLLKGMAIAYEDRRRFLGDPRFGAKSFSFLNRKDYLQRRWNHFKNDFGLSENDEEQSTTHFVVVDRWGNWVSSTQTIGDFFGSGVEQNGFFLNNSLNKFCDDPKSPNAPAPGKRPYSYMAPSFIFKSNRPVLALGSPGGRRIPAILSQAIIYRLVDGRTLEDACREPRFFLAPDRYVFFEKKPPSQVISNLERRKFQIVVGNNNFSYGSIQTLGVDEKTGCLTGAADPRREGNYQVNRSKKTAAQNK